MRKSSNYENIRALRIRELLKRKNLKQIDLAEKLDIEPQNLSRCLVSGKVSEKMCKKIAALFPDIQETWLLGYTDSMTAAEEFFNVISEADREAQLLHNGFLSFAQLSGFTVSINPIEKLSDIQNIKEYCVISREDSSITLDMAQLNSLENEICDMIETRLKYLIK